MANVFDVAAYILKTIGTTTSMKLQKLVYYAQAWSLVWDDKPLFEEKIQAWANGPVVPSLYQQHVGSFSINSLMVGDPTLLTDEQKETVDAVLVFYGDKSAQWLSDLTHQEAPWREARAKAGLRDGERGTVEITPAAMAEYYGSLPPF